MAQSSYGISSWLWKHEVKSLLEFIFYLTSLQTGTSSFGPSSQKNWYGVGQKPFQTRLTPRNSHLSPSSQAEDSGREKAFLLSTFTRQLLHGGSLASVEDLSSPQLVREWPADRRTLLPVHHLSKVKKTFLFKICNGLTGLKNEVPVTSATPVMFCCTHFCTHQPREKHWGSPAEVPKCFEVENM